MSQNGSLYSCNKLRRILKNFWNSFAQTLRSKFVIKMLLKIQHTLNVLLRYLENIRQHFDSQMPAVFMCHHVDWRRRGVVVTELVVSSKLLYVEPG